MVHQRKLAAIMFTDIEGYTALMQRSEQDAIKFRAKHREVFNRETLQYGGQILQYYGDGTLSVFQSAVQAVECAISIQKAMREAPIVPLRIGIHSGDIVFTEDDVIGDGVNVASRIESLAAPGSILVSDKVFDEIKNHESIASEYLKTCNLKHVKSPVGVYAITNPGLKVQNPRDIADKIQQDGSPIKALKASGKRLWIPAAVILFLMIAIGYWMRDVFDQKTATIQKKVVAVVPFEVEDEDEYFQYGMTQGLISELSKIEQIRVIDQLTTRFYAGVNIPFINLNQELPQVDFLIQGNVSRSSNNVNVQLSLKSKGQEEPVWSKDYQRDISEIRMLWSDVATDLTAPLGFELSTAQSLMGSGLRPVKPEIYELYLKGTYNLAKGGPEGWQTGITYLHQAVDQNPADAFAYAALAEGYVSIGHGPSPDRDVFPKAREAALRAIQLDSTLADAWAALSHYETYFGWDWDRAEHAFERANRLNPNLAMNHFHRAWYLILFGRKEEAIREHQLAEDLDPFSQLHTAGTGLLYSWTGQYEKALVEMDAAMNNPGLAKFVHGTAWKSTVLSDLGKHDEAQKLSKQATDSFFMWKYVIHGPVLIKAGKIEEGKLIIRELELQPPTALGNLCLGFMYALLGDSDNAIKWLSRPEKHGWYPWIRVWPGMGMESLYDDPRFLALLDEMHLPHPENLRSDKQLAANN